MSSGSPKGTARSTGASFSSLKSLSTWSRSELKRVSLAAHKEKYFTWVVTGEGKMLDLTQERLGRASPQGFVSLVKCGQPEAVGAQGSLQMETAHPEEPTLALFLLRQIITVDI